MSSLNQIASVGISLNTATVGKASFGIPLVVSPLMAFEDRLRKYTDYSAAVADGLDKETLGALAAIFSQTPRPKIAYVGRRDVAKVDITLRGSEEVWELYINESETYSVLINYKAYSYTAKSGDNEDSVLKGISSAIKADSTLKEAITDNKVNDRKLTLSLAEGAKVRITQGNDTLVRYQGSKSLSDDMEKIKAEDNSWYGWSLTERDDALISAGAQWTETQNKLFFAQTSTEKVWSSANDDIASQLQDAQYMRTVLVADKNDDRQYIDAAVMGRFFTKDPGTTVFALKNLPSVFDSNFSDTEKSYLTYKNVNTYQRYSNDTYCFGVGTDVRASGRVMSGEFIDVVRDRDWLIDDIQTAVASLMIRSDKIPYTNGGIALIANVLRARLQNAQSQGVIAPDEVDSLGKTVPGFRIKYPNAADVDADIKASRILHVSFTALLAGAIQLVQITGTLSYSNEA